jgi:hypothetical protein
LPPRLVSAFSERALDNDRHDFTATITTEEVGRTLIPNSQGNEDKITNRDVIPFKPPSTLTGPMNRRVKPARRNNAGHASSKVSETVVLPMVASIEYPATVPQVQLPPQDKVANRDHGPWSREAFDLFEWRPGPRPSIKGGRSKVG